MQCIPTSTAIQECAQRLLCFERRDHVAGVGHDEVRFRDGGGIPIVLEYPDADAFVLGEKLEQFQPGEVDIVVLSAGDQDTPDLSFWSNVAQCDLPALTRSAREPHETSQFRIG